MSVNKNALAQIHEKMKQLHEQTGEQMVLVASGQTEGFCVATSIDGDDKTIARVMAVMCKALYMLLKIRLDGDIIMKKTAEEYAAIVAKTIMACWQDDQQMQRAKGGTFYVN